MSNLLPLFAPNVTLKIGSTGRLVEAVQVRLRDIGYALKGTGYFGTATDAAVEAFQKRAGLKVDGVVGSATAKALDAAVVSTTGVIHAAGQAEVPRSVVERPIWLSYGLTLIGTKEAPGRDKDNETILGWARDEGGDIAREYTHDWIPFCSLFENHIITKAGLKGTETLWALDWNADRMEKRVGHRWPGVRLPGIAVGAIAPMMRNGGGHVITVVGRDQHGNVMGLGSNQSDTTSVIPFALSRLNEGLWWPDGVPIPTLIGFAKLPLVRSDGRVSSAEA